MNNFNVAGVVRGVYPPQNERAPWSVLIETKLEKDKSALVYLDVYTKHPPQIGNAVVAGGYLDSREWNGRYYPKIVVTSKGFFDRGESANVQKQQNPPPPTRQVQENFPELEEGGKFEAVGDPHLPF